MCWFVADEMSFYDLDIDECEIDNGGCDETCVNINGSYSCKCDSGLDLIDDGKSCGCKQCYK